ncbi:MAG: hypothetical protein ACK559_33925, partial [bacterium]
LATVLQHAHLRSVEAEGLHPEELILLGRLIAVVDSGARLPEIGRSVLVLQKADAGAAQQARRQHADAPGGADRDGTSLGELLAHHSQHRGPEERLADAVDGGGDHAHEPALGVAQERQANRAEERRGGQQAQGRDPFHDRSREESQHEHQAGRVDEQEQAVGGAVHDR